MFQSHRRYENISVEMDESRILIYLYSTSDLKLQERSQESFSRQKAFYSLNNGNKIFFKEV
jgi:hypothetical protein